MQISTIIYFCNCYLIMLDYEEELKDIICDFKRKEIVEKVIMLKKECGEILGINDKERIEQMNRIMVECLDLDIGVGEMKNILEYVYENV
ncbi:hypothetical protein [Clostridium oceanicum]|uniref:Uncharacterized protein n=1 Tax=Clostridium oceanicum TaxID=1543 RepID=A0ABP3UWV4_9CLOT